MRIRVRVTRASLTRALPVAAVLLLAALLRFARLDAQSLWYDEGVSAFMTTRNAAEIARAAAADIHPPLYYWLLAAWAAVFGPGELALRGLSALLSVASVAVLVGLGTRLFDRRVGLLAGLLLAVSPLAVQYGQEVRMYALAGFLATSSTLQVVRFIERPSLAQGAIYGALAVALIYTHYYGVLVLAVHQLCVWSWIVVRRRREALSPWSAGSLLVVLLYLPWLPNALRQTGYYPGLGTPQPAWALVVDALNVQALGIATTRFELRAGLLPILLLLTLGLVAAARAVPVGVVSEPWIGRARTTFPSWHHRDHHEPGVLPSPWRVVLLTLWLFLPLAVIVWLSRTRPLYEPRFLVLTLPAWTILVAAGLDSLARTMGRTSARPRGAQAVALAGKRRIGSVQLGTHRDWSRHRELAVLAVGLVALLVPTARSLAAYSFDPAYARDDYRGLVRYVTANERADDAVVLTAPGQAEVFGYYYRGRAPVYPLPQQRPLNQPDTTARLEALAAIHPRVWLVRWAWVEADPTDFIGRWLDQRARVSDRRTFGTVELRLFQLMSQR